MKMQAKITSKGQITVPVKVRRRWGCEPAISFSSGRTATISAFGRWKPRARLQNIAASAYQDPS